MDKTDNKLGKENKLCNKTIIDSIFEGGGSVFAFPLRCVYKVVEPKQYDKIAIKVLFSVSKRNHKKAVSRNRIKRLMREAYRLNKPELYIDDNKQLTIAFIYTQKDILEYTQIENGIKKGLYSIKKSFEKDSNLSTGPLD